MFDPNKSYDDNYRDGPQKSWVANKTFPLLRYVNEPRFSFLGQPLHIPFGIPAGPLLNSSFMNAATNAGFCMPTYKTVRSHFYQSHPLPNVLQIVDASPDAVFSKPLTDLVTASSENFSISNSFGVPSMHPEVWQPDVCSLALRYGYINSLSFQPTIQPSFEDFLSDARLVARLAGLTRAQMFEINLSCPNEKGLPLYHDIARVTAVLKAIRQELPSATLIAKIGELSGDEVVTFVRQTCEIIDAISAINTLRCRILDVAKQPALGADREFGGVCGQLIFDRGVFMIKSLASVRRRLGLSNRRLGLIGVGGVFTAAHVQSYLQAGADVVQAATGAMWNLELAGCVAQHLDVRTERETLNYDHVDHQARSHQVFI